MAWRGQGGKRAKGRRGDQDPELDNTAWLADLEEEAARADDEDEDDWASTLRGRRSQAADPGTGPASPPPEPGWAPADPAPPAGAPSYGPVPDGAGGTGYGPEAWAPDPAARPPAPDPDPDWSWRRPAPDAVGDPGGTALEEPTGGWEGSRDDPGAGDWRSAGVDTPTGTWEAPEPVGREPDYPALFGELYRRSAGQQDPIWEAPPAAEPLPEPGAPDPQPAAWPFEETTQSWEPSDRSFIWPADELPSTPAEWDQPAPPSWLDDPAPPRTGPDAHSPAPAPTDPDPDQTAAWSSPWAAQPEYGNGLPPPSPSAPPGPPPAARAEPPAPTGPPPDDWAAAIPTDVPAARRAADPSTRMWRPDEQVEAEPGVPLGPGPGPRPPAAGEGPAAGTTRLQAAAGEGTAARSADPWAEAAQDPVARTFGARAADRAVPLFEEPDDEPDEEPRKGRRDRQGGRQARAWPRIVAVISWIVLVMVVCWFYVFPWLERVLPENF